MNTDYKIKHNLVVENSVVVGSTTENRSGAIQWDGANFTGYNGSSWIKLDKQGTEASGTNQEIQFNNNGSFGSSSLLKWDGSSLLIDGELNVNTGIIKDNNGIYFLVKTDTKNVFIGANSGSDQTPGSGSQNIALGDSSFASYTTASNNICLGYNTGNSIISNMNNVLIGSNTGSSLSHADANGNVLIGSNVGSSSNLIKDSVYIGSFAGGAASGDRNIAIGLYSGKISTGISNVYIGEKAGENNGTGVGNVYIGTEVGKTSNGGTHGNHSVIIGFFAGTSAIDATDSVLIGPNAGYSTISGIESVMLGNRAGYGNTTGQYNTYLGSYTGNNNSTGSNNVFIGYKAGYLETGSNKLYIANNETTSLIYGEFDSNYIQVNGRLDVTENIMIGAKDAGTITEAGMLQWNGTNFQGYNGTDWINLDIQGDITLKDLSDTPSEYNEGRILFESATGFVDSAEFLFNAAVPALTVGTRSGATGKHSLILGEGTTEASGISSIGIYQGRATGNGSFAMGNSLASAANSFAFGTNNTAAGQGSMAIGTDSITGSSAANSFAFGHYTEVQGTGSIAAGLGLYDTDHANKVVVNSNGSFAFTSRNTGTDTATGINANYSAILGGTDHSINAGATNSVILGGDAITATEANTVYVPNLISLGNVKLGNSPDGSATGSIRWNGTNFQGKNDSGWVDLDSQGSNPGVITDTSAIIDGDAVELLTIIPKTLKAVTVDYFYDTGSAIQQGFIRLLNVDGTTVIFNHDYMSSNGADLLQMNSISVPTDDDYFKFNLDPNGAGTIKYTYRGLDA